MKIKVGIFIFDDVEILDFTGPYEVFSSTRVSTEVLSKKNVNSIYKSFSPFDVCTISENKKTVITTGGMKVISDYTFKDINKLNVLLIPGGKGTRKILKKKNVLKWINKMQQASELTVSVCTGSLLLAAAGLLKNKCAATHWSAAELLKKISPTTKVLNERYVLDTIYSSSGVASGIDVSFKVVEKYFGMKVAQNTSKFIEYKLPYK